MKALKLAEAALMVAVCRVCSAAAGPETVAQNCAAKLLTFLNIAASTAVGSYVVFSAAGGDVKKRTLKKTMNACRPMVPLIDTLYFTQQTMKY